MRTGVYPGTFDPVTLGHMDIIRRGAKLVDRLVIGVTTNPSKSPMFTLDERMEMVRREAASVGGDIQVVSFDSLLMDFAEREGASMIVRGLRHRPKRVRVGGRRRGKGLEVTATRSFLVDVHMLKR